MLDAFGPLEMFALYTQHFGTNSYEIVYISGSDKMTTIQ